MGRAGPPLERLKRKELAQQGLRRRGGDLQQRRTGARVGAEALRANWHVLGVGWRRSLPTGVWPTHAAYPPDFRLM